MQKENGYVVSILPTKSYYPTGAELWFGRKVNPTNWINAESFMTNGLKPFIDLKSAQEAENELKAKIKLKNSEIFHIDLNIAENSDDLELLRHQNNLVVIQTVLDLPVAGHEIYGKSVNKASHNGYLPGSFFNSNGRRPFDNYFRAEDSVREIQRQAASHATIATLVINKMH